MDILALLLAFGLVLLNGFFVATEFAIVKVRPTRIEELIRNQKPGAATARILIRHLDAYLSATQLGITLASLGLGWLGEPAFARILEGPLGAAGITDPAKVHFLALVLAFATITFLHITVGELAPKTLAILRAESVAIAVAWPMRVFYWVLYPFTTALNATSNALLRLLGLRAAGHAPELGHSEDEIKIILAQARSAGLLSSERAEILHKAMSLPTKSARHLMVPRSEVVFLDVNLSLEENLERAMESGHARFPLCNKELDEVLGIIDIREVLYQMSRGRLAAASLRTLARPATYFPETMSGERLLTEFRNRRIQMAIIVDEYGGASGIVTPADVVTTVMGELDEGEESELIPLPGGAYDVEGTAPIEEVEEALNIELAAEDMRTVAGFLMKRLGRMPQVGDRVMVGGFGFHVIEVHGPRVRKVRIQRESPRAGRLPAPGERRPTGETEIKPVPADTRRVK